MGGSLRGSIFSSRRLDANYAAAEAERNVVIAQEKAQEAAQAEEIRRERKAKESKRRLVDDNRPMEVACHGKCAQPSRGLQTLYVGIYCDEDCLGALSYFIARYEETRVRS